MKPFKWTNKDWIWLMIFLISIIIVSNSIKFSESSEITNIISFISSGISIVLAIVAIAIALKQDYSSLIINNETKNLFNDIKEKISKIDNKVDNIDSVKIIYSTENITRNIESFKTEIFSYLNESAVTTNVVNDINERIKSLEKSVNKEKFNISSQLNKNGYIAVINLNDISNKEKIKIDIILGLQNKQYEISKDQIPVKQFYKENYDSINIHISKLVNEYQNKNFKRIIYSIIEENGYDKEIIKSVHNLYDLDCNNYV